MNRIITYHLFLVLIFVCCTDYSPKRASVSSHLDISITQEESLPFDLTTISDTALYIKLETNDSCLIDYIKKIYGTNDYIIIGSNRSVLFFDRQGNFKYSLKHIGSGPHEYLRFTDFCINDSLKEIYIFDSQQQKIITYNYNGEYISHDYLGFWAIGIEALNDSTLVMYHGNQTSSNQSCKLTLFNTHTHKIIKHKYPIAKNKSKYLHVRNENNFAIDKNGLSLCELYNDTIYSLSEDGMLPIYRLDFDKDKIDASIFNKKFDNIIEFQKEISKYPYSYGVNSLISSSDYLLLSYYDEHKRLLCYYDKNKKETASYKYIIDPVLSDKFQIDIRTNHITFYSDADEFFMIADNSLYMNEELYKDNILDIFDSIINEEDNPIIRISKKYAEEKPI